MATYYVDFENGNDANDGSTWALAWKSLTTGATAARIAAGDVIRMAKSPAPFSVGTAEWTFGKFTGATKSITSSTNATPIVMTVSSHGYANGDIIFQYGHATNTNANGVWAIANVTTNTYELVGSVGNGTGSGGTAMNITAKSVTLATSGLTKMIENCEYTAWTAANSGTVTRMDYSYAKQGAYSMKIAVPASPVVSTKYAYKALAAETDYSGFQKISFWLYNSAAILATHWKICLCSDAAGDTIVDTFELPANAVTSNWTPFTLARVGGGNLGATIQSIAIYSNSVVPTGSSYVYIDDIIACTTSGINLQSLISKNSAEQGGTENWFPIQSIDDTIVVLDCSGFNTTVNLGHGYWGTSESVTTYCRQTTKADIYTTSAGPGQINDSGTSGYPISFQGGYNTSTDVQEGETIIEGWNGYGSITASSKNYITLNHISYVRGYYGIYIYGGTGVIVDDILLCNGSRTSGFYLYLNAAITVNNIRNACGNASEGVYIQHASSAPAMTLGDFTNVCNNRGGQAVYLRDCLFLTITTVTNAVMNAGAGIYFSGCHASKVTTVTKSAYNGGVGLYIVSSFNCQLPTVGNVDYNSSQGLYMSSSHGNIVGVVASINNNTGYGVTFNTATYNKIKEITSCQTNGGGVQFGSSSYENEIGKITTSGNATRAFNIGYPVGKNYVNRATVSEATVADGFTAKYDTRLCLTNFGDVTTDHRQYTDGGRIVTDPTVSKSGISWKWIFSDTTRVSTYPIEMPVAHIAVEANKAVTVKIWVRKTDATCGLKVIIRGGQLAGMSATDIEATASASSEGTWEELTLSSFTPTQAGIVEIVAQGWYISSTSSYAWVDEMTISQAA